MATVNFFATGVDCTSSNLDSVETPECSVDGSSQTRGQFNAKKWRQPTIYFYGFDFKTYFDGLGIDENRIKINSLKFKLEASCDMPTSTSYIESVRYCENGIKVFGTSKSHEEIINPDQNHNYMIADITAHGFTPHHIRNSRASTSSVADFSTIGYTGMVVEIMINNLLGAKIRFARVWRADLILDYTVLNTKPIFKDANLIYNNVQIGQNNKVPTNEGYLIRARVEEGV